MENNQQFLDSGIRNETYAFLDNLLRYLRCMCNDHGPVTSELPTIVISARPLWIVVPSSKLSVSQYQNESTNQATNQPPTKPINVDTNRSKNNPINNEMKIEVM